MLPLCFHTDGAEVFTNAEYNFWSWSSATTEGPALFVKFPIACIPAKCMHTEKTKKHVHAELARLIGWSLFWLEMGIGPPVGFYDED